MFSFTCTSITILQVHSYLLYCSTHGELSYCAPLSDASSIPGSSLSTMSSDHLYNLPSAHELRERLDIMTDRAGNLQRKNKTQGDTIRRLQKKVVTLSDIIVELENERYLSSKASELLDSFNHLPGQIFKRYLENHTKSTTSRASYPPEVRAFALTLYFYSPKGYSYVRDTFDLALPHPFVISSWYSAMEGEPGFTDECFATLEARLRVMKEKGKDIYLSLMCDELSIMKRHEWDPSAQRFRGYVDLGCEEVQDNTILATSCLVFMVVSMNESWKLPIGFFFVHGLDGKERANLSLLALQKLEEAEVTVTTLVCDGPQQNTGMLRELGAKLDHNNMQSYFFTPGGKKIYIMLDVCHMMKLVRNCLERQRNFRDLHGRDINWKYLVELELLQSREGLRCGTKITRRHISFHREKMKVKLATQLLSSSVADAIQYCDEVLKLPQFKV